jgi:lipopolysaccharide export system protein LptA
MDAARFSGGVRVETGELTGLAEEVAYDVGADQVTFGGTDAQGRIPLVNDSRGALLATSISVRLGGPDITATGAVSSVLSAEANSFDSVSDAKRPQLLNDASPIYVTATEFAYDGVASRATYTGTSRLWQDSTEFRADSLVLDEASGDVSGAGSVETQILIMQNADDSEEPVQVLSTGSANTFEYIDETRTANYSANATLLTEIIDLTASTIKLVLETDGRSLDQILASGGVTLKLEGRQMVGETMTYYENDGRYEMTGDPVRIIEEVAADSADSETETIECRETTGQSLTFYVTSEALSVDAQSEIRTTSMNQPCPAVP